jgi:hypothetical protein
VKALTQEVVWYVLLAGMFVGPVICLAVAVYLAWQRRYEGGAGIWIILASVLCASAAYAALLAGFFYQRKYGFEFNDPTIRLKFVHWGSSLATFGTLIALLNKKGLRTVLLIGCLLIQMYWFFQVQAI